ncbi:hypothetical protein EYB53_018310 [Candidatus Chloroploca sp. M-50]|uniref:Uncharacterized protein n=1 Tax=Candidatus Chloroploca mongolica TaxID=2528176 RepID=A0ABS4DE06_9CHLR|nr:hypothetical protein [Candidatus Chloroploca mongolica]MBP1467674.1 hypothetical protein [Candidatus Chloroploca mongolica]
MTAQPQRTFTEMATGLYTYPDVTVVGEQPRFLDRLMPSLNNGSGMQ